MLFSNTNKYHDFHHQNFCLRIRNKITAKASIDGIAYHGPNNVYSLACIKAMNNSILAND